MLYYIVRLKLKEVSEKMNFWIFLVVYVFVSQEKNGVLNKRRLHLIGTNAFFESII